MTTTQVTFPLLPVDHSHSQPAEGEEAGQIEVHEEEEHHAWLGGSTAVKYLLAGGVAGAGEHLSSLWPLSPDQLAPSFSNLHRTIRSAEDIPDHSTTRPSSCCCVEIVRYEGGHQCGNEDIRRERNPRVLDREWAVGCEDPPRVCHQVPVIRVLCKAVPFSKTEL